ncbi:multiple inositol polyphosphate phosphatase 1-like [Melanaphis sacchari]|uniref:multiple inositol polyphosphate phosphatase 1-like n=1 Tax=Melanaphis sacchari TaxID=742174 RepID=UPI000DC12F56|nr:multiple inositol polyphosphate phosphatase 1-like [Melanaphis sacchari]
MKFIVIILPLIIFNCIKCELDKCFHYDDYPFSFFATKTAYSYVSAKQNYTQPNCKALQLWLLSRHGTRHPSRTVIDKISNLKEYTKIITDNSSLCKEDFDAIKTWIFNLTEKDENKLNSQGVNDLLSLGLRLQSVYEDIFNQPYNPITYSVLSSSQERSRDSAFYFLKSVFNMNVTDIPLINNDDIKLNISKFENKHDNKETKKFRCSVHMQEVIVRVSKILGLDRNLTFNTIKAMYDSCRYERSLNLNSHPAWCAVFSQKDLEVLEYDEDLKYYYSNGYGDPYNERLGCPIIKDLMNNFKNKSQTQLGPKGVFYFGHSSNVLSAIVRLGFARDTLFLLSSNFNEMRDRKWKTSYLSPFASNIMAVLYECNGVKKVTFFINEIPMIVERYGCTLCPWELIENMFDPIISSPSCIFDENSSASDVSRTMNLVFFTYLLNIFYFF